MGRMTILQRARKMTESQLDADNVVVQALAGSNAVQTVIVTSTVVHAIYPSPTGLASPSDAISAENPFAINTGSVLIPLLEESDYKSWVTGVLVISQLRASMEIFLRGIPQWITSMVIASEWLTSGETWLRKWRSLRGGLHQEQPFSNLPPKKTSAVLDVSRTSGASCFISTASPSKMSCRTRSRRDQIAGMDNIVVLKLTT
mmetsp:Transcript_31704/g.36040  ORF Transcript_31704/g.36040 Transcript_31704/m.36040 type:complete len:202 (-) Transcript_31704:244-849(-)